MNWINKIKKTVKVSNKNINKNFPTKSERESNRTWTSCHGQPILKN